MRRPYNHISGHHPYAHPHAYAHFVGQPYAATAAAGNPYLPHPGSPHFYDSQYNRKRQRRQAAAVVVQSLWDKNMGRKSTAQPRPVLHVPPRGIGPIVEPNENDVLCGRGGRINSHSGNVNFRDVINAKKKEYLAPATKKLEKAHIAAALVNDIRSMDPPGRFLKEDRETGWWFDIGDAKAIKKTGQALREDAPDIRPELEDDSSGDEKSPKKEEQSPSSPKADKKPVAKPKSPTPKSPQKAKSRSPPRQARQPGSVSGRGPQHTVLGGWPQGNGQMTPQDYQAQVAMPPPYSHQVNPYVNQSQQVPGMVQNQPVGVRNIPILAPNMQGVYTFPNNIYTGAKSVGQKVATMSKHAMETLSQTGRNQPNQVNPTDEDLAFGRPFHPPTVLSSGNTLSTISGLSNPLSSGMGMDTGSGTNRSPTRSGNPKNDSMRLSELSGFSNRPSSQLMASRMSELSDGSFRSVLGIPRSSSFPDMSSIVEHSSWNAIMEGSNEELMDVQATSLLSGVSSGRFSSSSGRMGGARGSGAMSIATMSTASSNQWLAGMRDSALMDDGRSILSEMSSDLNALDLASDARL